MRSSSLRPRWDQDPTPTRRSTVALTAASPCCTLTPGQEREQLTLSMVTTRRGQRLPGLSDSFTPWRGRPVDMGDTDTLGSWTACSWSRVSSRRGLMTASTVWTWRSRSCSTVSPRLLTSSMIILTKASGPSYTDLRAIESNSAVLQTSKPIISCFVHPLDESFMFGKYCHKIFSFWSNCKCIGARVKTVKTASVPRMIKYLIYWDRGFHILQ